MDFGINHAPDAGSIGRLINLQSSLKHCATAAPSITEYQKVLDVATPLYIKQYIQLGVHTRRTNLPRYRLQTPTIQFYPLRLHPRYDTLIRLHPCVPFTISFIIQATILFTLQFIYNSFILYT